MFGSDLVRPGLEPKANYNIGFGHANQKALQGLRHGLERRPLFRAHSGSWPMLIGLAKETGRIGRPSILFVGSAGQGSPPDKSGK
jgi:hypothetical protein